MAFCAATVSASSAGRLILSVTCPSFLVVLLVDLEPRVEPGEGLVSLAGESEGIIGSFLQSESDFPSLNSSSLGSLSSACARRFACSATAASARVCPGSSSLAVSAAVARAHASILHGGHAWVVVVVVVGCCCCC